jgi:hypothetical protein
MSSAEHARNDEKWFMSLADESPAERRKNIVMLQWLVTIATSYLSLFGGGALNDDPLVLARSGCWY